LDSGAKDTEMYSVTGFANNAKKAPTMGRNAKFQVISTRKLTSITHLSGEKNDNTVAIILISV
jgi:hypothetical protein